MDLDFLVSMTYMFMPFLAALSLPRKGSAFNYSWENNESHGPLKSIEIVVLTSLGFDQAYLML